MYSSGHPLQSTSNTTVLDWKLLHALRGRTLPHQQESSCWYTEATRAPSLRSWRDSQSPHSLLPPLDLQIVDPFDFCMPVSMLSCLNNSEHFLRAFCVPATLLNTSDFIVVCHLTAPCNMSSSEQSPEADTDAAFICEMRKLSWTQRGEVMYSWSPSQLDRALELSLSSLTPLDPGCALCSLPISHSPALESWKSPESYNSSLRLL